MGLNAGIEEREKNSFGRRAFLKGSAMTLGIAATAGIGCSPKPELEETDEPLSQSDEQVFMGACRGNCGGGCALDITVREGKVVATTAAKLPDSRYNRICQRGHSHLQRIYDPDRIKHPLRRVGARGADEWEQITWDEAIEEITTKWKQYQEESGPDSIAFMAGSGNFGVAASYYTHRLKTIMGATTVSFCYDNAFFHGNGVAQGVSETYNANELTDIINAKVIILWGANYSESFPQCWHFYMEAKAAGAKIVTIDPNYTVSASRSDIHVPLRPGTDNALVMAMINHIVDNDWIDSDFIKKSTVGPFLVKKSDGLFLRHSDIGIEPTQVVDETTGEEITVDPIVVRDAEGAVGTIEEIPDPIFEGSFEIEGNEVTCAYTLLLESCKEWTVSRAAELCDLPENTITELAELYALEGPSTISQGFGPDHYTNGHSVYFTLNAMAAITGNLGKPGASCGLDWLMPGLIRYVRHANVLPETDLVSRVVTSPKLPDIIKNKEVEGEPINLRSMYIWVSNPVSNQTDRNAWIEAFEQLDLVVVADMTLGDTARYADIVLPVIHWFEEEEIMPQTSPYLLLQEKAIDPLYESKSDVEIINLLGNAMGYEGQFDYTVQEYLAATLANPAAEADNITLDRIREEKYFRIFSSDPHIHARDGVFPTATGRQQFYLEAPAPYVSYGQTFDVEKERLPYWEPPVEAWPDSVGGFEAVDLSSKYPIIFTTERNKMKCHTQWGHSPWLLELYPEPTLKIHPDDASERGISEGDYVRAFNDRGEAVFKTIISSGCRPGVVIAPKGWEEDQFIKGHYSDLTSRAYNPVCPNNCFFDALIELEKTEA